MPKSIFKLSVRHIVAVAVALLTLLPALAGYRIAMIFSADTALSRSTAIELAALVSFTGFAVFTGFFLLLRLVSRLQEITKQSLVLHDSAAPFFGGAPSSASSPTMATNSLQTQNELESLTMAFARIQLNMASFLAKLKDKELLVRNLETGLQTTDDVIVVLGLGNEVLFSNRAAREKFGLLPERDVMSAMREGILSPQDADKCGAMLAVWKERDEECEFVKHNGDSITVRLLVAVDKATNEEKRKVVVIRDLTERNRLERQLFRSEKLAALGQLISGVAHELNNPLAAILGFAELCRQNSASDDELDSNLEIIEREARRTTHIVENLLNFSRKRTSQRVVIDIHELIERCVALLAYNFRSHNIMVKRDYDSTLPDIEVDEYQIQQVLMNIIINAAQAMHDNEVENPRITISTALCEADDAIAVEISDNGPGIPNKMKTQIFEPFFTTKQDDRGTGLGLPVSKRITEAHGGQLLLEDAAGQGAKFIITLPVSHYTNKNSSHEENNGSLRKKMSGRILAVDDEESILSMTGKALAKIGLTVETANSVKTAIAHLKRQEFDLILVDVFMPDGNGEDVWEFVQKTQPQLTGKVIFMSGDSRVRKRLENRLGIEANILQKPFHVKDLYSIVQTSLRTETAQPFVCSNKPA